MHSQRIFPVVCVLLAPSGAAQVCPVERVSVNNAGEEAAGDCYWIDTSGDGSVVAFVTRASNLGGPTNSRFNIFARLRASGQTVRVSTATSGVPNEESFNPRVSTDGRWVTFYSRASNLVPNDTNSTQDVFVRDLAMATTQLVSRSAQGLGNGSSGDPVISSDGSLIAFDSGATNLVPGDNNARMDVFVKHVPSGAIERVSVGSSGFEGNGNSWVPEISGDGNIVAFESWATNLATVPGGWTQIYVRDRNAGTTELISVNNAGMPADTYCWLNDVSEDGRFVLFHTQATNLEPALPSGPSRAWLRDRHQARTILVSRNTLGEPNVEDASGLSIAGNAPWVSVSGSSSTLDLDGLPLDTGFVHDTRTGFTFPAYRNYAGQVPSAGGANIRLSQDGSVGVFVSNRPDVVPGFSTGLWQVYARSICGWFATACGSWPTVAACPCGNEGRIGLGCGNSVADTGAGLRAVGTPSVSQDTVRLEAWDMPRSTSVRFLESDRRAATVPFADGITCLGATVRILGWRRAEMGSALLGGPVVGDPPLSVLGPVPAAGGLRLYQAVYRDHAQFCTSSLLSTTNTIAIQWLP